MSWLSALIRLFITKPPVVTPEPSQPPRATLAVHVLDRKGAPVQGATFRLNEAVRTTTDANGYAALETFKGEVFYAVEQEGYASVHGSIQLEQNSQLPIWLDALLPALPGQCRQLVGGLSANAQGFYDTGGPVLPVFCHAGDLFSLYTRNRTRAQAEMLKVRNAGYHGMRVWTVLTGPYWEGPDRHVRPTTTPDYWGQWHDFVRDVRDLGLTLVVSQGDLWQLRDLDKAAFARKLAEACVSFPGVYAFLDAGNETWQNGMSDERELREFIRAFRNAGGSAIFSLTSPPGEEAADLRRYSYEVWDKHGFRGGHLWDKRRHAFSVAYEGVPDQLGIESEPPGPGALVSVMEHKGEMTEGGCALLAVANVTARAAFVYFNGDGVRIQQGLDTEPGFFSVPKVVAALPRTVMDRWEWTLHHSGERWATLRLFDIGVTHEVRVDGVQSKETGEFVYTIDGPPGTYSFRVARAFTAQTLNTVTGERSAPFTCAVGSTMMFQWTPAQGGVILVGRVQ